MDGHSPEITKQLLEQLKNLVPEAFADGRLQVEALKRALGEEHVLEKNERYHLDWPGKSAAYKLLQAPSSATLRPQPDLSVNFDTAEHVFIEGENLEVLKVLQKAYFGKVKLIYIDPPYNTGSDSFIYPDRFQESKADYLKRINELDDDGQLMREGFFRKNNKENGHYHSNWLNMMLPRLYLARNLLREDGVIFVSIDDNEVHNLRCVMNEIFGEENFVGSVIWKNVTDNNPSNISTEHESIIVYARSKPDLEGVWQSKLSDIKDILVEIGKKLTSQFKNQDELQAEFSRWFRENKYQLGPLDRYKYIDKDGVYTGSQSVHNPGKEGYRYDVLHATTRKPCKQPLMGYRFPQSTMNKLLEEGKILFGDDHKKIIELKVYAKDYVEKLSSVIELDGRTGAYDLKELFPEQNKIFTNPKPVRLLSHFISFVVEKNDLVLDFFSGSATTAQAILTLNTQDEGKRKFILVQLPEFTLNAEYPTIADIARERIRRVIQKIHNEADLASPAPDNLGFKSFVLAPSNFKQWRGDDIETAEQLAKQLELFVQSEKEGADIDDILYELLLKAGFPLTTPLERLSLEGATVWRVNNGELLFVLEAFHFAMIAPLLAFAPKEILCLDSVFQGSDELKTNLDLQCRDARIRFTCV